MMSDNLKIAMVGGGLSGLAGGAPRSIATHAAALRSQGIEVTVFGGYSRKYPLTLEQFDLDGIEVVASRLWGPSVLGLATQALGTLFKQARTYDVIHLNGHWNLTTFLGALIARMRGVPYVITARGHLGKYDFEHLKFLKLFLYPLMEIPNLRHAALAHVCSDWEKQDSARALKHARRVVKVPNAVDLEMLLPAIDRDAARRAEDLPENAQIYLFLARVAPDKCPEMLLRAWAAANMDAPSLLVMAGPATPAYEKTLINLATSLGIANQVRFTGYADNEQKKCLYSAADVFLLPSTDDSFSVAVVEAAAFGLRCILSPFVGASEFVPAEQVESVPLTENDWTGALKASQTCCAADPFAATGWKEQFSQEQIGAQWKTIYNGIIRGDANDGRAT